MTHLLPAEPTRRIVLRTLVAAGVATLAPMHPARSAEDSVMSIPTAHERAREGSILLVDIRRPSEWRETGLAQPAIAVTMHDPAGPPGFLEAMLAAVDGDRSRPVALICASGVRSSWARRFLAANGFERVHDVREGMLGRGGKTGWIKRGLPLRAYSADDW